MAVTDRLDVCTTDQWETLVAIADAVIPAVDPGDLNITPYAQNGAEVAVGVDDRAQLLAVFKQYRVECASAVPHFRAAIQRSLSKIPHANLSKILLTLSALRNPLGCLVLTGSRKAFHLQPVATREATILSWQASYLASLRLLAKVFTLLCTRAWLTTSRSLHRLIGFPLFPITTERMPGFPYTFIEPQAHDQQITIDADVVIVGSGCGGGVCAKVLAEAGLRVLVVDKGYYFPSSDLPMAPMDAFDNLFEGGGTVSSDGGGIMTMAGSTWGGGGTVNWSASLQTTSSVREEWSRQHGLRLFSSPHFQSSLDRVSARMGVSTKSITHNIPNQILLEGARRLGYAHAEIPQNTGGCAHECGLCTLGCASATKKGPGVTFLPDAARAGARFIQGFTVERITLCKPQAQGKQSKVEASGIEGVWHPRNNTDSGGAGQCRIRVAARRVIVSAGALNTPLLLAKSGFRHPQLGKNLFLHPVTVVRASYQQQVRPWEGSIMTGVVDLHEVKLEVPAMPPYMAATCTPWRGGQEYKEQLSNFHHWAAFIALTRDRDGGVVFADPVDGGVRIDYTLSGHDQRSMLEGVVAAMKIHHVMGAEEIASPVPSLPNWVRQTAPEKDGSLTGDLLDGDTSFDDWIAKLRRLGLPSNTGAAVVVSAHQMGSCRMSSSCLGGVVDEKGLVWGTSNVYVADASVFPTASGVNPMLTTMAISDWIARGVAEEESTDKRETTGLPKL